MLVAGPAVDPGWVWGWGGDGVYNFSTKSTVQFQNVLHVCINRATDT